MKNEKNAHCLNTKASIKLYASSEKNFKVENTLNSILSAEISSIENKDRVLGIAIMLPCS